jgi:hypothetical protein
MTAPVQTFRFKFSPEFSSELETFSKINQHEDRHRFKSNWDIWCMAHGNLIQLEIDNLNKTGYTGDILDKMFKSARYYFRKKVMKSEPIRKEAWGNEEEGNSREKNNKEDQPKKHYIRMSKTILDCMDQHISANINTPDYKPSTGYENFCETCMNELKEEIVRLIALNKDNPTFQTDNIRVKIKKTYKNRYYQYIQNKSK